MPTNNLWTKKTAKAATSWDKRAGEAPQDTLGTMQEAGDFELGYTIKGIQNQMNDNKSFYWGSDKDYFAKYAASEAQFEISKDGESTPDIVLKGSGADRDVVFGVDVDFQGDTTAVTQLASDASTKIATTAFVQNQNVDATFDSVIATSATIGSLTLTSGTISTVSVDEFTDTEFRGGTY